MAPATTTPPTPTPTPSPTPAEGQFAPATVTIGAATFTLELARTPQERAVGLSGRTHLPEDHGMLFIFDSDARHGFWMKDTLIPLDIIWLDSDGVVVDVQTMQPEPGVPDPLLTVYRPSAPARYVLEVNAGLAQRHGIQPGAQARFS